MSRSFRTVLTAVAATASLACFAAPAMAQTGWQARHPARAEIDARLARQDARIRRAVETGRIDRRQAARLHRADERIRAEEQRLAAMHGGELTPRDRERLNREADDVSARIGR